jgi:hypothetical protein
MTACSFKFILICLISASLLACSASGETTVSLQLPVDNEIADVRNLPQDVGAYTSSFREGSLSKSCRDSYLSEFRREYFAPWSGNASIIDISASAATMKEHLQKVWYGGNKSGPLRPPPPM